MSETLRAEVVAIGASAGGVEALSELVRHLPADFAAPILVVLHVAPTGTSVLPQILERRGPLAARLARDGDRLEPGGILVAPGDYHIRTVDGHVALDREPRENGHRPAVDPLFRSVADSYGSRAVGAILSGTRDDGTAGLKAIKAAGGWAVAQDPETALYGAMAESAIANVPLDAVLDLPHLASALSSLVTEGCFAKLGDPPTMTDDMPISTYFNSTQPLAGAMHFACPDCGGVMTEFLDGGLTRFHCHVGHVYSLESLLDPQFAKVEEALWTAVRALEERAAMLRRTARMVATSGQRLSADSMEAQAHDCAEQATLVRSAVSSIRPIHDKVAVR